MAWIKRNLVVVISGVICLALLGFGGWYLWQAMQKNDAVDNEIGSNKAELDRLMNEDPFPSSSNINNARQELEKVNAFMGNARKLFPPPPAPATPLNDQTFKSLLRTTIDELNKQATAANVKLSESNYAFSFKSELQPVSFPPESLLPLSQRLHEIRSVCSLLIEAKIARLDSIRRAHVTAEAATEPKDYVTELPRLSTETGMMLWPYEVVFDSFSPELAAALEGFARNPAAIVVRSVVVEPAEVVRQPGGPGPRGPAPPPVAGQPQPPVQPGQGRRRYPRANVPPNAAPGAPRTAAPAGLVTLLEEHLLRVTLKLDVIEPAK